MRRTGAGLSREQLRISGLVALAVVTGMAVGASLWPHAFTQAAFGVDLAPEPSRVTDPGSWVDTALVRIAGVLVATFASLIFAMLTEQRAFRWVFAGVGTWAVFLAGGLWYAILPNVLGLGVTALCMLLVGLGFLALTAAKPPLRGGT